MPLRSLFWTVSLAAALMPAFAATAADKPAAKPAPRAAVKAPAKAAAKAPPNAPTKAAAKPAARAAKAVVPPAPPPEPPLPAAGGEQLAAAAMTYFGPYECEFNQALTIDVNKTDGYVDVRMARDSWTMKPVLSSTGVIRLEDVKGRMLLLQVANKSMLMDAVAGRRVVDDCVHEKQRAVRAQPQRASLGITPGVQLKLRLMATADIRMALLNHDYYEDKPTDDFGLAKTATLIKAARAEAKNSLLFDNGDLLQGSALGEQVARVQPLAAGAVHPAYKVLNALGVDAANIGNHEFNHGLEFLRQAIAGAGFPVVSANVVLDDGQTPAFRPYVILDRTFTDDAGGKQNVRVGVIGFVPPQVMQWDRANLAGKVKVLDIVDTARRLVPDLRARGADIVVAIPHSGFGRADAVPLAENTVARLAEVPGIDAILFGHSQGEFPSRQFAGHPKVDVPRGTINGVPAVMPGRWGDHLGVVDLQLDNGSGDWRVTASRAEIRPIVDRATKLAAVEADPMVAALVGEEHQAARATMRAAVAQTAAPIDSYFAQVADDASVQLVSAAQLAHVRQAVLGTALDKLPLLSAAAPFKTGGRAGWAAYADIPAGPVALRSVADLAAYPDTVHAVQLSGAQVREWLEMAAGQFNRIDPAGAPAQELLNPDFRSDNFDTIDGVTYRIDVTQRARYDANGKLAAADAHRILDLRFSGQPIDPAAQFLVVTNKHRASGGGGFPGLDGSSIAFDAPDDTRQILAQHLRARQRVEPAADGNWAVQPVPGVRLRFTSGAGGMAHLARHPNVALVKDNGDGSAVYELRP